MTAKMTESWSVSTNWSGKEKNWSGHSSRKSTKMHFVTLWFTLQKCCLVHQTAREMINKQKKKTTTLKQMTVLWMKPMKKREAALPVMLLREMATSLKIRHRKKQKTKATVNSLWLLKTIGLSANCSLRTDAQQVSREETVQSSIQNSAEDSFKVEDLTRAARTGTVPYYIQEFAGTPTSLGLVEGQGAGKGTRRFNKLKRIRMKLKGIVLFYGRSKCKRR